MKQITSKELRLLSHNFQVRFALFCANQVKEHWETIPQCVEAIRITELWLENKATSEECRIAYRAVDVTYTAANAAHAAAYAVYTAANAVSNGAAYATYTAAAAAAAAAHAAANAVSNADLDKARIIKEQWDCYNQLLSFHEEFEKRVLT